jgi:hypothetical protein
MSDEKLNDLIIAKLEKVNDAVQETKLDIVEIKGDLLNHIRRTDIAEENLTELKTYIDAVKLDSDKRIGKFEGWYDKFHFLGWLIAGGISILHLVKDFLK